jgi:hypothetical protein
MLVFEGGKVLECDSNVANLPNEPRYLGDFS